MKTRSALMLILAILLPVLLSAGEPSAPPRPSFGLTLGAGGGSFPDNPRKTSSFMLRLDLQQGWRFIALRLAVLTQWCNSYSNANEASLMYGLDLTRGKSPLKATVAAGLGLVNNWRTVLGLPLEAQLFTRSRGIQLGVTLMANINSMDTFWGWAIGLRFGRG